LCEERLGKYGVAKGKLPSTLEELFSLSNSSTLEDMDDGLGDGLGGFGECDMPDYNHECELELDSTDSEEEPEDDEAQDDQDQYSTEPSYNLKRNRKEVDSWTRLIAAVTANVQTPTSSPSCSCRKSRKTLPTVSLFAGISQYTMPLTAIGFVEMDFEICEKNCPVHNGMLGFISKGFYPSSPVRPKFAFHNDVLDLFHEMYMRGPSSKHVYARAIRAIIQKKSSIEVKPCYFDLVDKYRFLICISGSFVYTQFGWIYNLSPMPKSRFLSTNCQGRAISCEPRLGAMVLRMVLRTMVLRTIVPRAMVYTFQLQQRPLSPPTLLAFL
jgi:hypothetical protein